MIVHWTRQQRHRTRARALGLLLTVVAPAVAAAQQADEPPPPRRALTLDEAIRLAARESEQLQIARAGVRRAGGQLRQARSGYLPQLNSNLQYGRALRSQFSALATGGGADTSTTPQPQSLCTPPLPANATPAERAAALAAATTCPSAQGIDFSRVGFGARNSWTLGLSFSQNVFTGGRLRGLNATAAANERSAQVELTSQRAQLALDVTQAYFDAVLADRLVTIADTSLAQTEELLRQTSVARQVGNTSEFELLRATVTRDNQRPVVIARRGDRDVAYFRLKQLLNLPLDQPLSLVTPIEQPETVTRIIAANATTLPNAAQVTRAAYDTTAPLPTPDTTTDDRAPVRESAEALRAQEGQLRVARADRLPSLAITSSYQRLFFPSQFFPLLNQFSENWNVGGSISLPLFTGGRISGSIDVAQANLDQARAQLQQTRELAALDTRVAFNQLQQAEASFNASRGTAAQAQRAYSIDQIRYREGISTQTDLLQSRLLMEQAAVNQATSARDVAVARARIVLLRDLPISVQGVGGAATRAVQTQQQQQQQQLQQQQQQQQTTTSAAAANQSAPATTGSFSQ
jgi:outer membrane protein